MSRPGSGTLEQWTAYAKDVIRDREHGAQCVRDGGTCLEPGMPPDLHWPGYLGAGYRRGGLLVVGNVHQSFSSGGFGAKRARQLAEVTLAWREDEVPDGEYFSTNQVLYREGLGGSARWNVGVRFAPLLDALGLTWDDVAYTNAAKTQLPAGDFDIRVVRRCQRRFSIAQLATTTLGARLVLTNSATARDALRAAGVPHRWFRQLRASRDDLESIRRELVEHGLDVPATAGSALSDGPPDVLLPGEHAPRDLDVVRWLLQQPGGEAWSEMLLLRALREQPAWSRQFPHLVRAAGELAERYGVRREREGGTIRLRRT